MTSPSILKAIHQQPSYIQVNPFRVILLQKLPKYFVVFYQHLLTLILSNVNVAFPLGGVTPLEYGPSLKDSATDI